MKNLLIGLSVAVVLSACDQEAGHWLDTGTFGDSTLNNALVQSGERDYTVNLANRFASEVPTTINFAFDSELRRNSDFFLQLNQSSFFTRNLNILREILTQVNIF